MLANLVIKPLTEETLEQAIKLAHQVFPDDAAIPDNNPGLGFIASLRPEEYQHLYKRDDLVSLSYYLLINTQNDQVIGTTGFYKHSSEPNDLVWLGWYCIDPAYRGLGLGKYLLQWTVDKAKKDGNRILRLYTSNDPEHDIAQKVYEKFGFVKTGEEKKDGYDLIYKEVDLYSETP